MTTLISDVRSTYEIPWFDVEGIAFHTALEAARDLQSLATEAHIRTVVSGRLACTMHGSGRFLHKVTMIADALPPDDPALGLKRLGFLPFGGGCFTWSSGEGVELTIAWVVRTDWAAPVHGFALEPQNQLLIAGISIPTLPMLSALKLANHARVRGKDLDEVRSWMASGKVERHDIEGLLSGLPEAQDALSLITEVGLTSPSDA